MSVSDPPTKESKASLQLDPGPEPRRKAARPVNICKTFCLALTIASALIGLRVVYLGLKLVQNQWSSWIAPHHILYHNDTEYEGHQVVRPLIEEDQLFDIVATVWIRDSQGGSSSQVRGIKLVERPIFTDTIFRGVKMSKKIYKTSVNLEIPTAAFQDTLLGNYDLRGSFVLVPNSPSLMDKVLNYLTWVPSEAMRPPSRAYPDNYTLTLADKVADAYGIFTPLLSFHEIKSRCQPDEKTEVSPPNDYDTNPQTRKSINSKPKIEVTTEGKSVLKAHPYIITRTHLNIMDMTRLYDRRAFARAYYGLSMIECGERSHNGLRSPEHAPDWRLCHGSFLSHANSQLIISYSMDEGQTCNTTSTNWAYAPYLFVDPHWGPLDLTAVPVNREECTPVDKDPKVVNITWNISFGSITNRKHRIAHWLGNSFQRHLNMSDTEEGIRNMHSLFEFTQELLGQRFNENLLPAWIAWVLVFFSVITGTLRRMLFLVYWYIEASTSTVGISVIGTMFLALGLLMLDILGDLTALEFLSYQWMLCFYSQALPAIIMPKAVTRASILWSEKTWILVPIGVRFARPTHAERTSQRVEARTSWRVRLSTFAFLAAMFCLATVYGFDLFAFKAPDLSRLKTPRNLFELLFARPLVSLGTILQVIMNFQSKTFAGEYKLGARLNFLCDLCLPLAAYLYPPISNPVVPKIILLFGVVLSGVMFIQSFIYPKPEIMGETDDE